MKKIVILFLFALVACKKPSIKPKPDPFYLPVCSNVDEREVMITCKYAGGDTSLTAEFRIIFDSRLCNHPVIDTTYKVKSFNRTFKLKTDSIQLIGVSGSLVEYTLNVSGVNRTGIIQPNTNLVIKI